LALLGLILAAADVATTYVGLQRPGVYEQNPLALAAWAAIGFWPGCMVKIATATVAFAVFGWACDLTRSRIPASAAGIVVLLYCVAITTNLIMAFA
jgi:hypothetical protein